MFDAYRIGVSCNTPENAEIIDISAFSGVFLFAEQVAYVAFVA